MNKTLLLLVFIFAVISTSFGFSDSIKKYPDSTFYWVNVDYLAEINTGTDVCAWLSKNPFLLLHIDSNFQKVTIQSSIFYFGQEMNVEMDLIKMDSVNKQFRIEESWPLHSSMKLSISSETLLIAYDQKIVTFKKVKLKTLDIPSSPIGRFSISFDIYDQCHRINAETLRAYRKTDSDSTNQLVSFQELVSLIDSNKVSMGCADDFYSNFLMIEGEPNRHFEVVFDKGSMTLYEEPKGGRGRGEILDKSELQKQVFYLSEWRIYVSIHFLYF